MSAQAMMTGRPVRVLIVDDSAMIRKMLALGLATDPMIEVVGTASGAEQALQMIVELSPDVMTLDIEMPRMDGVTFLRQLLPTRRLPTVVISSATQQGARTTLAALEAGAVDVIPKPSLGVGGGLRDMMSEICLRVRAAATTRPGAGTRAAMPAIRQADGQAGGAIILIGASTGGVQALARILQDLPRDTAGTVIVQHMPEGFTAAFAARLDATSAMTVREARDGDAIQPGVALIAPGGTRHLTIVGRAPHWRVALTEGPPVCFARPSVDVMFHSAAKQLGPQCVAALLTGMGRDGADGLLALRRAGATTMAQDDATSVVWGMPGAAVDLGAAESVLPIEAIPPVLVATSRAINAMGQIRNLSATQGA